jgi:hypothetical protein
MDDAFDLAGVNAVRSSSLEINDVIDSFLYRLQGGGPVVVDLVERFARRRDFLNQRGFLWVKQECDEVCVRAHDARPRIDGFILVQVNVAAREL